MAKPLDRKSPEGKRARAQSEALYTIIGEAITHWSDLEGRLVRIAAKLLKAPTDRAGLVLYSIASFPAWINIISDLFALDNRYQDAAAKWKGLIKRLFGANDYRVRIAHQGTQIDAPGELRRAKFDVRGKSLKAQPLTKTEIAGFIERVDGLYEELIEVLKLMQRPPSSS